LLLHPAFRAPMFLPAKLVPPLTVHALRPQPSGAASQSGARRWCGPMMKADSCTYLHVAKPLQLILQLLVYMQHVEHKSRAAKFKKKNGDEASSFAYRWWRASSATWRKLSTNSLHGV